MIIDNLDDKRASWSAISDNVMGGISEVNFYEIEEGGEKFYRLEGANCALIANWYATRLTRTFMVV